MAALTDLQTQRVSFEYPSELTSLTAIRTAIKNYEAAAPVPLPTETVEVVEEAPSEKQVDAAEPEQSSSAPKQQNEQPKAENEEEII